MAAPTYVLGHRNPDTDSICSAIGYAALLREQGESQAVAARAGDLRPETEYLLQRFGVEIPLLVTDVRPRVSDVMTSPAVTVHLETLILEAGQLLQTQNVRAIPVVDDEGTLCGVIGVEDFARGFITGLDQHELGRLPLDLEHVRQALDARILVAAPERTLTDRAMVGAMEIESMLKRLEPDILLVVGDREDAQRAAIEFGVGALAITGDIPVSQEVIALARERHVTVMVTPHHTYATVHRIYMSVPVRHIMRTEVATCGPGDLLDEARETLRSGAARSLVVIDESNRVQGLISRSNLLRATPTRVALVDHNERSQAVEGIEEAEVIAVVDHHRVADFQTRTPPFMRLEPVGATSTIVGKLFAETNIDLPPSLAGVLLGGILADTLLFRGPTTTAEDRRVGDRLARRAGVDLEELGDRILAIASDVSNQSAEQLLMRDFKEFQVNGRRFGIGTIETTNGAAVLKRHDELLEAMERLRQRGAYTDIIFAVIDIVHECTTLLVAAHPKATAAALQTTAGGGHRVEVPGILSRKKNIVPLLGAIGREISAV